MMVNNNSENKILNLYADELAEAEIDFILSKNDSLNIPYFELQIYRQDYKSRELEGFINSISSKYFEEYGLKTKLQAVEKTNNKNDKREKNDLGCFIDTETNINAIIGGGGIRKNDGSGFNSTLGVLAKNKYNTNDLFGLSCGHGVDDNSKFQYLKKNNEIVCLGERHYHQNNNYLDYSIIKIKNLEQANNFRSGCLFSSNIHNNTSDSNYGIVYKYGYITKGTSGLIKKDSISVANLNSRIYRNVIKIEPYGCSDFSKPGDSGSIVFSKILEPDDSDLIIISKTNANDNTEVKYRAIGLLLEKNFNNYAFAIPIERIILDLDTQKNIKLTFNF